MYSLSCDTRPYVTHGIRRDAFEKHAKNDANDWLNGDEYDTY